MASLTNYVFPLRIGLVVLNGELVVVIGNSGEIGLYLRRVDQPKAPCSLVKDGMGLVRPASGIRPGPTPS